MCVSVVPTVLVTSVLLALFGGARSAEALRVRCISPEHAGAGSLTLRMNST